MRAPVRLTAAVCTAVTALAAGGCAGPPSPKGDQERAALPPLTTAHGATVVGDAEAGAVEAAQAFALAARGWDAASLRARWRRQLALSAGELRRTLRRTPPLAADLERLRADRASATATVLEVATVSAEPARVRLLVRLRERTTVAGQATEQTTDNQADVVRRGGRWRIAAFTLAP